MSAADSFLVVVLKLVAAAAGAAVAIWRGWSALTATRSGCALLVELEPGRGVGEVAARVVELPGVAAATVRRWRSKKAARVLEVQVEQGACSIQLAAELARLKGIASIRSRDSG